MVDACAGWDLRICVVFTIVTSKQATVDFLCDHRLFARKECPKCGSDVDFNDSLVFHSNRHKSIHWPGGGRAALRVLSFGKKRHLVVPVI